MGKNLWIVRTKSLIYFPLVAFIYLTSCLSDVNGSFIFSNQFTSDSIRMNYKSPSSSSSSSCADGNINGDGGLDIDALRKEYPQTDELLRRLCSKEVCLSDVRIVRDRPSFQKGIVKSLIWRVSYRNDAERLFCTVLPADRRVDRSMLLDSLTSNVLNVVENDKETPTLTRDDVRSGFQLDLADPNVAEVISGCKIGSIPPLGHVEQIPVLIDRSLIETDVGKYLYGGCGIFNTTVQSDHFSIRILISEMIDLQHVIVTSLSTNQDRNTGSTNLNAKNIKLKAIRNHKSQKLKKSFGKDEFSTRPLSERLWSAAVRKGGFEEVKILFDELRSYSDEEFERILWNNNMEKLTLPDREFSPGCGKNILHRASWKGDIETVRIIINETRRRGIDIINSISTGIGNYGKTAIFYALTQDRDDVVLELLSLGASVLICNNKGQSPVSISISHVKEETISRIVNAEKEELENGGEFTNFRATHNDNRQYGDLDPRFLNDPEDKNLSIEAWTEILEHKEVHGNDSLPLSVRVTTKEIRRKKLMNDALSQKVAKAKREEKVSRSNRKTITRPERRMVKDVEETLVLDTFKLNHIQSNEAVVVDGEKGIQILEDFISKFCQQNKGTSDQYYIDSCWGIDAEWKPNSMSDEDNPVAVLQIAKSKECTFVIDLQQLSRSNQSVDSKLNNLERRLCEALSTLFLDKNILILGFGVSNDLQRVASSYPHLKCFQEFHAVIDLVLLSRHIFPNKPKYSLNSLSKLCQFLEHKDLDKSEQCSTWHLRPLTDAQIEYAALDAAILPHLFNKLVSEPLLVKKYGGFYINKNKDLLWSWRYTPIHSLTAGESAPSKMNFEQGYLRTLRNNVIACQNWSTTKEAPLLPGSFQDILKEYEKKRIKKIAKLKVDVLPITDSLPILLSSLAMSKTRCIISLLGDVLRSKLPSNFELLYDRKSDIVVMSNAIILFVDKNIHSLSFEDKVLSFSFNPSTKPGQALVHASIRDYGGEDNNDHKKKIILFMKSSNSELFYCGRLLKIEEFIETPTSTRYNFSLTDQKEILESTEMTKRLSMLANCVLGPLPKGLSSFLDDSGHNPQISEINRDIPLEDVIGNLDNLPLPGNFVGGTKEACIRTLIDHTSVQPNTEITYNPKSGIIEMSNLVLLFVNCLNPRKTRIKYRNDFFNDGRSMSFSFDLNKNREKRLYNSITSPHSFPKELLLFARPGKGGKFIFCGNCTAVTPEDSNSDRQRPVVLLLRDFDCIQADDETAKIFQEMVDTHMLALSKIEQ